MSNNLLEKDALSYDNVALVAEYSDLISRINADTTVSFLGRKYKLPVILANMDSVINPALARELLNNGYFYIMGRLNKPGKEIYINGKPIYDTTFSFVHAANLANWELISASIGVNKLAYDVLNLIYERGLRVDVFTIDVAHADSSLTKGMINAIKHSFPNTKIIAGNIMTSSAYVNLVNWGADAIKVGIGQGNICSTKYQTGFTYPMFSCIQHVLEGQSFNKKVPIIADGGINHIGDIPKALVAGASLVMCGKLFASCVDSAAEIEDGKKVYYGSTSTHAKGYNGKNIEGFKKDLIPENLTVLDKMDKITEALQSAIGLGGGKDLNVFRDVKYITLK